MDIIFNILDTILINALVKDAAGHADPIGEQSVEGVSLGPKVRAGDPGPDPFKHKLSLGDNEYITFHLSGTIKIEVE